MIMSAHAAKMLEDELSLDSETSPRLERLLKRARRASDMMKAMSHESRLMLLCLLAEKERSVGELEQLLSLRQPIVSQQLARLRYDNLVSTRRDGKTVYYFIEDPNVRRLTDVIYDIFCEGGSEEKTGEKKAIEDLA